MMMTIALRFVPTLLEETDKIMAAQKARGADMESGGITQRIRALVPVLIPLFVSAFRRAFDGFDLATVCTYGDEKIAELGQNSGIVRNRLKIKAAVNNAQIFRTIQQEWGSFDNYLWHWTEGQVVYETGKVSSELSDAVSKDLKHRGMKFVGTVIVYSYLQAVGVINSHEETCFCRQDN